MANLYWQHALGRKWSGFALGYLGGPPWPGAGELVFDQEAELNDESKSSAFRMVFELHLIFMEGLSFGSFTFYFTFFHVWEISP